MISGATKRVAATRSRDTSADPTTSCAIDCAAQCTDRRGIDLTDRATAERVVARTLSRDRARVQNWLARQGPRPNLAIDYRGDKQQPIGRSVTRRNPKPVVCSDAVVVLRWDGQRGFFVLTSYPEVSR